MTELYILLQTATIDKSAEADTIFGTKFAHFNDASEPGPDDTSTLYHIHNADFINVLGWCWSAVQLRVITHFQIQQPDNAPEIRLIAFADGDTPTTAYSMFVNDDTAQVIKPASRPFLEKQIRESWPNALFIPLEQMKALITRCGCGQPTKGLCDALCDTCDKELKAQSEGNEWNDDQHEMWVRDVVAQRMGQKPDLLDLIR